MKVIEIEEAKANLERYADECRTSPVVVSVGGKPAFELLPIRSEDADFIDRLLDRNAAFRELAEARRREADAGKVSSLDDVRKRLAVSAEVS